MQDNMRLVSYPPQGKARQGKEKEAGDAAKNGDLLCIDRLPNATGVYQNHSQISL